METETSTDLAAAQAPLIDALAQTFALYGWSETMGRIYGLLLFAEAPLSQDELSALLGVSKATVNTGLRSLETLHFVHRVGKITGEGGGRPRLFYEAEPDFKKVFQELLHQNVEREVAFMSQGVEETRRRLEHLQQNGGADATRAAAALQVVHGLEGYLRLGRGLLWLVQSMERLQRLLSLSRWTENGDDR